MLASGSASAQSQYTFLLRTSDGAFSAFMRFLSMVIRLRIAAEPTKEHCEDKHQKEAHILKSWYRMWDGMCSMKRSEKLGDTKDQHFYDTKWRENFRVKVRVAQHKTMIFLT